VETELDTVLAYDIELFLENDSEIYHKNIVPVLRMISKHYDKGRGDKQEAVKAIERYIVQPACKKYLSECFSPTAQMRYVTPKNLREYVASELFDKWQEGLENKNSTDRYW
jgi:hypothetical protein